MRVSSHWYNKMEVKMQRRAIVIISVLLCLTAFFAMAETGEIISGDYVYKVLPDGTAEIIRYSHETEWDIESMDVFAPAERNVIEQFDIPASIDGYYVSSIAARAFYGMADVIHVTVPEGVTSIGIGAFNGCDDMISIKLPNSLAYLGGNPFEECYSLTSIELPPNHPYLVVYDDVLFSIPDKRLICFPYSKQHIEEITDPNDMFYGGKSFDAEYDIPHGVEIIGDAAFAGCEGLNRISIPNTVVHIGDRAFSGCALEIVDIPNSVTSIGSLAFYYNFNIEKVVLPASLTTIGDNPFAGCEALGKIKVASSNPELGIKDGVLFSKSDMRLVAYPCAKEVKEYKIPKGVKVVGAYAFLQCSIEKITVPSSVTTIGEYAFADIYNLKKIIVPDSVTEIGEEAFRQMLDWDDELVIETEKGSYARAYWENYIKGAIDDRDDHMSD